VAGKDAAADAEVRVERVQELLEQSVNRGARLVARTVARAREEAEDIWAEARSLKPPHRP